MLGLAFGRQGIASLTRVEEIQDFAINALRGDASVGGTDKTSGVPCWTHRWEEQERGMEEEERERGMEEARGIEKGP